MGNIVDKTPLTSNPPNRSLLNQLKLRTLEEMQECYTVLKEDYPEAVSIEYSQFDDIFGLLLDDPEPFFLELQNEKNIDGTVDVHEILAAFTIFCGDKFERKAMFIFKLFDFDHNDTLEVSELILTLQSAARGLCKFIHIEAPSLGQLEDIAKDIFVLIDHDRNKRVSFDEFMFWLNNNGRLQDFLLKYAGTQTYENMKKRYDIILAVLKKFFTMACEKLNPLYCKEEFLREIIKAEANEYLAPKDLDFLFEILKNSTLSLSEGAIKPEENLISKQAYEIVMKAWSAFSAADINNDNSLVPRELYSLIWVYESQEPSELRIKNEMAEIDKTKDGHIDRYEWMRSLCSSNKQGKMVFRANLKTLFDKYDVDNSGTLTYKEIRALVGDAFKEYSMRAPDVEKRNYLNSMIDTLAEEILNDLDSSGEKSIAWEEFKNYMEVAIGKFDKLKSFLNMNF